MNHGSLFSGIGGFDLAAEWMGWDNLFHCEWNEFGQKVLHYYWPNAEQFTDITKTDFTKYANRIDILTGGFPCQPYSLAGKRKGKDDERHLWPEMLRAIREIQPRWVVGENVLGIVNWNGGLVFNEVQTDLEAAGYKVFPYVLPACAVNANHRRDRTWFVAYRNSQRCEKFDTTQKPSGSEFYCRTHHKRDAAYPNGGGVAGCRRESKNTKLQAAESNKDGCPKFRRMGWGKFPTQSPVCSRNDGISERLDGIAFSKWRNESIKAYGNAVVPQVVYQIFKAIEAYESANS